MSSSKVCVGVRVRPLLDREDQAVVSHPSNVQIQLSKEHVFTFDYVFQSNESQNELYERAIMPMTKPFMDGYNVTLIAYGQTGSGKTFTMGSGLETGAASDVSLEGCIPRFLTQLFTQLPQQPTIQPSRVTASFLEIYNEEIRDLLHPSGRNLQIRQDSSGIWVENLSDHSVESKDAALSLLRQGSKSRVTGSTNMNDISSRSHAVFTITVTQHFETSNVVSKLTFVDLAGSERLKRTKAKGTQLKEGVAINSGLFALGNVINALGDEKQTGNFVPYRSTKLTRLLQDALGGNSRTFFLACISPAQDSLNETLNTLRYANRAKNIENKAVRNVDEAVPAHLITFLEQEILCNRFRNQSLVLNQVEPDEVSQLYQQDQVQRYLAALKSHSQTPLPVCDESLTQQVVQEVSYDDLNTSLIVIEELVELQEQQVEYTRQDEQDTYELNAIEVSIRQKQLKSAVSDEIEALKRQKVELMKRQKERTGQYMQQIRAKEVEINQIRRSKRKTERRANVLDLMNRRKDLQLATRNQMVSKVTLKLKETEKQLLEALDQRRMAMFRIPHRRPSKGLSVVTDLLQQYTSTIDQELLHEVLHQQLCKALRQRANLLQQLMEFSSSPHVQERLNECEHQIEELNATLKATRVKDPITREGLLETLVTENDRKQLIQEALEEILQLKTSQHQTLLHAMKLDDTIQELAQERDAAIQQVNEMQMSHEEQLIHVLEDVDCTDTKGIQEELDQTKMELQQTRALLADLKQYHVLCDELGYNSNEKVFDVWTCEMNQLQTMKQEVQSAIQHLMTQYHTLRLELQQPEALPDSTLPLMEQQRLLEAQVKRLEELKRDREETLMRLKTESQTVLQWYNDPEVAKMLTNLNLKCLTADYVKECQQTLNQGKQKRLERLHRLVNGSKQLKSLLNDMECMNLEELNLEAIELDCFTNVFDETMDEMDRMLAKVQELYDGRVKEYHRVNGIVQEASQYLQLGEYQFDIEQSVELPSSDSPFYSLQSLLELHSRMKQFVDAVQHATENEMSQLQAQFTQLGMSTQDLIEFLHQAVKERTDIDVEAIIRSTGRTNQCPTPHAIHCYLVPSDPIRNEYLDTAKATEMDLLVSELQELEQVLQLIQLTEEHRKGLRTILGYLTEIRMYREQIMQFEAQASDKSRLFGRSSQLLKEEKFRKKASRVFPSLITKLRTQVAALEIDLECLGPDIVELLNEELDTKTALMHLNLSMVKASVREE